MPDSFTNLVFPNKEGCSFIREIDGIQFLASVRTVNVVKISGDAPEPTDVLHVSLAPIRMLRSDWSEEEHSGHIFDIAFEVINSFFPNRQFTRQVDDPRKPNIKHYMSPINE